MLYIIAALFLSLCSCADTAFKFRVKASYEPDVTFTEVRNTWLAPAVYLKATRLPTFRQYMKGYFQVASNPELIKIFQDAVDFCGDEVTCWRDEFIQSILESPQKPDLSVFTKWSQKFAEFETKFYGQLPQHLHGFISVMTLMNFFFVQVDCFSGPGMVPIAPKTLKIHEFNDSKEAIFGKVKR